MTTPIFDALVSRHRFAAMADAWCGTEVDPGEDTKNEPVLGEPDEVLAAYGFPEVHPTVMRELAPHLGMLGGQS